ncbi:MAG TPA: CBS domain-containing protein [Burkholderiales bacterium]|nr:CBS domain-containing protein [Burkholderiales bacterium]
MTKIGELCERDVVVTGPETIVADAAKLMRTRHVGCVVVVDRREAGLPLPQGIVTDRDLVVEIMALGLDASVMAVGDIMSQELVTVHADADPHQAMRLMRAKGLRRLPVVTANGGLIGLVAFDDLLEFVTGELSDLTRAVGREQAREAAARR